LAQYYSYMSTLEFASSVDMIPKSLAAATKALEIDPQLGEAYSYLAFLAFSYQWDWPKAEELFERALQLRPDFILTHIWYSCFLCAVGRLKEATLRIQQALQLDPLSPNVHYFASVPAYLAREFDLARKHITDAIELDKNFGWPYWVLGLIHEQAGNYEGAIESHRKAAEVTDNLPRFHSSLGCAYGLAGKHREAQGVLSELQARAKVAYVPAFAFATVYFGMGDLDRFFDWLEKSLAERSYWLIYLNVELQYDPVRSDPRFRDVIRRIGFSP
jgi:tetratricopeptide (TPR) repeat protein